MPKILTISKDNTNFPEYLDWELLRNAGIEHIKKLGSDLWTDYNLHDPGITILEVLCYALTDLGYRTSFDIKDILARSSDDKNKAPKTIFDKPQDDNFFTAAEILSCNPVTPDDFRKLLIDIPGVRNAWFELAENAEIPIAYDPNSKILVFANDDTNPNNRINLQGLYELCLELEPLLVRDACGSTYFTKDGILETVYATLNAHRNLCEDFKKVSVYGEEQIQLCAQIELESGANPENVLLAMYKSLEEHLSPTLPFYTLQEMLKKGISMEEIFEGRPLSKESHGFIDKKELKKMNPRKSLYTSDFYRIIMEVDGVIAVRNLTLANAINNLVMQSGEKWCLNLTPKYRPHFDLRHSQITFYKGVLPFNTDTAIVEQRYLEERAAKAKAGLEGYHLDLPIPDGQYRDMEEYTSIMEEFPLTYGLGTDGIKGLIDVKRKGQAMQLKAYLLFFDQFLANYLSQLAHVRDLFSMERDENRVGKTHTYFTQLLTEVPGITDLLVNFKKCDGKEENELPPEDFPTYLQYITENLENYQERRSRFLDHLLARFSESFSDYVLLMYEFNGKKHESARVNRDKADFLSSYPEISRNRGKAFDYTKPVGCEGENDCGQITKLDEKDDPENISGLERRVSRLIGIETNGWKKLSHALIEKKSTGWHIKIKRDNKTIVKSRFHWETEQAACQALKEWQKYIGDSGYYRRLTYETFNYEEYALVLKYQNRVEIALGTQRYPTLSQYCNAIDAYFSRLGEFSEENVYLESIDDTAYYVVKDVEGQELTRLVALKNDLDTFKSIFKNKKYYCRKTIQVEKTHEYGFIIVNEEDECILENCERFFDEEEREDAMYWLMGQIKWSGLEGEAKKEEQCFFFQLFDFSGEKILLESTKGFHSKPLAMSFFDPIEADEEGLIHWAIQPENYDPVAKGGKHSFRLLDGEGKVTGLHPHWYDTKTEAQHIQQAIIFYLRDFQPSFEIDGTPGSFEFEVSDTAGNLLFISIHTYPTTVAAHSATSLIKALARHRRYYKSVEDKDKDSPYGFELVDRADQPFAAHPHWYTTSCERDLAMDAIIYYSENLTPQPRLSKREANYFLDMLSPNGDDLLNGMLEFQDKELAMEYWEEFSKRTEKIENFHQDDSGDENYPYGFKLLDKEGKLIARSAMSYATEAESQMAIRAIANLVRHTEWMVDITGKAGNHYFWIGDDPENKLLESVRSYPDNVTAGIELKNILKWGQNRENYSLTNDFGFELKNPEGKIIAVHPKEYESDGEAETSVMMVINYLINEGPKIDLPNKGGAFVSVIYDEKGKIVLKGSIIHSNRESALEESGKLLELASNRLNFKSSEIEQSRCKNGFHLVNKEGDIVATHPILYPSAEERDEVMASIFGWLTCAEKLKPEAIKKIPLYGFQLGKPDGDLLIEGIPAFGNEGDVMEHFKNFLEAAYDKSSYQTSSNDGAFGFTMIDGNGESLAKSLKTFESENERDDAIREIWLHINLKGTDYRLFEKEENWNFAILDKEGEDFLVGFSYLESKVETAESLIKTFGVAHSISHYLPQENAEDGTFSFYLVDKEGTILAKYGGEPFPTAEDLDEAIEHYLEYLYHQKVVPTIDKTGKKYRLDLKDFSGNDLLSGLITHDTQESMESEWRQISEAILDPANFEIVYDNLDCNYEVYIKDGDQILAQAAPEIASRTQAQKWIDQMILLLTNQFPPGDASGTTCGHYFLLRPLHGEGLLKDVQITGAKRFPTISEALGESVKAAEMLHSDELLRIEEREGQWQLAMYDEEGNLFAKIHPHCDNEADALEIRTQLRSFVAIGGTLDCENGGKVEAVEESGSYYSTLVRNEKIFLKSKNFLSDQEARATSNHIHELGQSKERYNLITNEEACLYSFELTDKNGLSVASHPTFYTIAKERDDALQETMSLINCEGLHLVEHILLRPRRVGIAQSYRFEVIDTELDTPILQGEISYSGVKAAEEAYQKMWNSLRRYSEDNESLVKKEDDLETPCQFGFHILTPTEEENKYAIIARSYGGFYSEDKRDKQLDRLIQVITDLDEETDSGLELAGNLKGRIYPLRFEDDLEGCELMLPIKDHIISGGTTLGKYVDPYSFRATVVLPYWPTRFQRPEFREFIETTLRQEAPAHVFLRICWVDTNHMREFEDAYCQWVSTLQSGIASCNAIEAKNKLIKTLCKLRSVYPVASLHDCEAPTGDSNRVVLNYSIIGSANSL